VKSSAPILFVGPSACFPSRVSLARARKILAAMERAAPTIERASAAWSRATNLEGFYRELGPLSPEDLRLTEEMLEDYRAVRSRVSMLRGEAEARKLSPFESLVGVADEMRAEIEAAEGAVLA
jgi:hypothetical protein